MKALIKKLVEIPGPPGYESKVREAIQDEIIPYIEDIQIDPLGNLIAQNGSKNQQAKKIMLVAHMDEIGLITTHVDENGFVRFTNLGAVQPSSCLGGKVRYLSGATGIIGSNRQKDPHHLPTFEHMFIDLGASNHADCPVKIGDVAAFEGAFSNLGEHLVSKALDGRVGVAVLIETLRRVVDTPHHLFFVFSTQEEVGVRGSAAAAFTIDPDLGIAVDATLATDTPEGVIEGLHLGRGPAIFVRDAHMLADPLVVDWMKNTAEDGEIPYQIEVGSQGSSDARAIQLTRAGVPRADFPSPAGISIRHLKWSIMLTSHIQLILWLLY
jgi:endoglucanase